MSIKKRAKLDWYDVAEVAKDILNLSDDATYEEIVKRLQWEFGVDDEVFQDIVECLVLRTIKVVSPITRRPVHLLVKYDDENNAIPMLEYDGDVDEKFIQCSGDEPSEHKCIIVPLNSQSKD